MTGAEWNGLVLDLETLGEGGMLGLIAMTDCLLLAILYSYLLLNFSVVCTDSARTCKTVVGIKL